MLHVETVSKQFPGVQALSDVSLSFEPGEIHAVVGENGAGKSTLIKVICGIHRPDGGSVALDGATLSLHSYSDAMRVGINLVSQEIQVVPKATIAENVMLDKLERFRRYGRIDWKAIAREAARYTALVGLDAPGLGPGRRPVGRPEAARDDRQGAVRRRPGAHPRRADLVAHPSRGEQPLRGPPAAASRRGDHHLRQPQAGRGPRDLRTACRCSGMAGSSGTRPVAELTKDAIVTMMLGRDAPQRLAGLARHRPVHGRPRSARHQPAGPVRRRRLPAPCGRDPRLLRPGRIRAHRARADPDRRGPGLRRRGPGQGRAGPYPRDGRRTGAPSPGLRVREPQGEGPDPGREHQDQHRHHGLG